MSHLPPTQWRVRQPTPKRRNSPRGPPGIGKEERGDSQRRRPRRRLAKQCCCRRSHPCRANRTPIPRHGSTPRVVDLSSRRPFGSTRTDNSPAGPAIRRSVTSTPSTSEPKNRSVTTLWPTVRRCIRTRSASLFPESEARLRIHPSPRTRRSNLAICYSFFNSSVLTDLGEMPTPAAGAINATSNRVYRRLMPHALSDHYVLNDNDTLDDGTRQGDGASGPALPLPASVVLRTEQAPQYRSQP